MSRTITVVTPENIRVTYQLAGIASRFMALLVDLLIQVGLLIVGAWLFSLLAGAGFGLGSIFTAVGVIYAYGILFFYSLVFEAAWGGRTPGKRLFGLRVIREGGYPLTLITSAIRNIMRFIDFGIVPLSTIPLTLWGTPGLLCIFFSGKYKRIGDYAAGTLVIVEAGGDAICRAQSQQHDSGGRGHAAVHQEPRPADRRRIQSDPAVHGAAQRT